MLLVFQRVTNEQERETEDKMMEEEECALFVLYLCLVTFKKLFVTPEFWAQKTHILHFYWQKKSSIIERGQQALLCLILSSFRNGRNSHFKLKVILVLALLIRPVVILLKSDFICRFPVKFLTSDSGNMT